MKPRRKLETPKYEEARALKLMTVASMESLFLRLMTRINREMRVLELLGFPWVKGPMCKPKRRRDAAEV